ncbi:MAG: hypothetical protein GF400_01315 [Candidatus Eisenbacteria bacterium]|nr:hypothetical protein [Candidatus Eisenbacteria bacterium]
MPPSGTPEEVLPDAPRILVMETGLLGELLVATPALRALKARWPDSRVTVMASPGSAIVLVVNPDVDRLLPLTRKERSGFFGVMRMASWIRSQRFDAAVVLHTSFRSALIAFMGAVPVRAGLACEGRGFLLTHKVPRDRSAYEVEEHLRVVGLLGAAPEGRKLALYLTDEERSEAEKLLEGVGGRPLVCLHPGASREIRRWPADRFAELGHRLVADHGVDVAYVFGPAERDLADAVSEWYGSAGLREPALLFPPNARALGAVFERSSAVVTNNTGPMHVAAAVGVPGVFIHGPTPVARWHPPGEEYIPVFADDVECRPCDSPTCDRESLLCMEALSVSRVEESVARLLEGPARAG